MSRKAQPNRTKDGQLACAFNEPWLSCHVLCAAETARICGVPVSDVLVPDLSRLALALEPDPEWSLT